MELNFISRLGNIIIKILMSKTNKIRTSSRIASKASKALISNSTTKNNKSVAASALANRAKKVK